jgi:putative chitinase
MLKIGSRGLQVRTLQLAINTTVDGIFGKATDNLVRDFQRKNGLVPDGVVGIKTNLALIKALGNNVKYNTIITSKTILMNEKPIIYTGIFNAIKPIFSSKAQLKMSEGLDVIKPISGTLQLSSLVNMCHFLGQIREEVGYNFNDVENLNYNYKGLINTFKAFRKDKTRARRYCRGSNQMANQAMIANIAYANRMGNGNVDSGDGWLYRGMGAIQTTFKDNNVALDLFIKNNLPTKHFKNYTKLPWYKAEDDSSLMTGALYWAMNNIGNSITSDLVVTKKDSYRVTKKINKYTHSYAKRWKHTKNVAKLLKLKIEE